jgi:hypothetical protein
MTTNKTRKPTPASQQILNAAEAVTELADVLETPATFTELTIYKPHIESYKLKMLIYGPPGVGKTSLLATAGLHKSTSPILLINVEGGMLSVAEAGVLGLSAPPDVVDLKGYDHLESIFWYLAKGGHHYKSVGIDSLSELQMVNLENIVKKLLHKGSASGARRESLDDIWRDDYGTSTQQLRRVVRQFRDLPMHVFFSCHDASSQDKDKVEVVHPALTPKLRTAIMGYMDIIGYMYVDSESSPDEGPDEVRKDSTQRRLLCRPFGKWLAKDRSPGQRLGLVVENPTIPVIIDRILGK